MSYATHGKKSHTMDLRRIVEEVEERKRQEYALVAPARVRPQASPSGGATASLLETVRDRMLREDPGADVRAFDDVIEPQSATPPPPAPRTQLADEPMAAAIARAAAEPAAAPARSGGRAKAARDDFLSRYLVMSKEFERRYKVRGWTELVRKKCSSDLRR